VPSSPRSSLRRPRALGIARAVVRAVSAGATSCRAVPRVHAHRGADGGGPKSSASALGQRESTFGQTATGRGARDADEDMGDGGARTIAGKSSRNAASTTTGTTTTTTTTTTQSRRAPGGRGATIKKPRAKTKAKKKTSPPSPGDAQATAEGEEQSSVTHDGEVIDSEEQTALDADDEDHQGQRGGAKTYERWVDDGASVSEIARLAELRRKYDDDSDNNLKVQQSESILHDIGAQIEITLKSVGTQTLTGQLVDGEANCRDETFGNKEDRANDSFTASLRAALEECEHALLVRSVYDPLDDEFVNIKPPSGTLRSL